MVGQARANDMFLLTGRTILREWQGRRQLAGTFAVSGLEEGDVE